MPAIPIVSGIFSDNGPDVRTGYPVNMMPVPKGSGVSQEYLRPADGIVALGEGPGVDRGGIEWNGVCYRVMGTKLVTVTASGAVTILGDVGGSGYVTFDYSFDRLAIASSGSLYYWNGTTLTQVTDPDLGTVLDVVWVDGYFMTTDGEFLVVTELSDPTQVNPLKYGSSEVDPDPVVALLKSRNEIHALNRHTIEVFDNVGGSLFPFQRIDGAQIMRGTVGTFAACVFGDMGIAFLGSARNEPPSVYLGANSSSASLATQDIDLLLQTYTEAQLAQVKVEARIDRAHQLLYVHLPDRTLVYDHAASQALNQRVWWTLTGGVDGFAQYPMRSLVWCYDKWIVGHTTTAQVGYLNRTLGSQWGAKARWEFSTPLVYNESKGAIFHELELVALPGRVALGINPQISTSYSTDGSSWSQDRFISVGTTGDTRKRLVWFQLGSMESFRVQRFRGDTDAHVSFLRLEARLEPLEV
jgi:hypothetical protein